MGEGRRVARGGPDSAGYRGGAGVGSWTTGGGKNYYYFMGFFGDFNENTD